VRSRLFEQRDRVPCGSTGCQVHVAVRDGDGCVTGQLLDGDRGRAPHHQVRAERVPENVPPRHPQPRPLGLPLQPRPHGNPVAGGVLVFDERRGTLVLLGPGVINLAVWELAIP
jgi:hypothetical protein